MSGVTGGFSPFNALQLNQLGQANQFIAGADTAAVTPEAPASPQAPVASMQPTPAVAPAVDTGASTSMQMLSQVVSLMTQMMGLMFEMMMGVMPGVMSGGQAQAASENSTQANPAPAETNTPAKESTPAPVTTTAPKPKAEAKPSPAPAKSDAPKKSTPQADYKAVIIDGATVSESTGQTVKGDNGKVELQNHGHQVMSVLGGKGNVSGTYAVPLEGAKLTALAEKLKTPAVTKNDLSQYLVEASTAFMDPMNANLKKVIDANSPETRAVNLSLGSTRVAVYTQAAMSINGYYQNKDTGEMLGLVGGPNEAAIKNQANVERVAGNPKLRQAVFGNQTFGSPQEMNQAIVNYVDQTLDNSAAVKNRLSEYQRLARQASQKGISIVVAAGNDHLNARQQWSNVRIKPGSELNILGMSPDVYVVAASTTNGTATFRDDQITAFSSRGGGGYNPTVALTGEDVMVTDKSGVRRKESGTSFSAPALAATILKMKEANPNLTETQIRQILPLASVDTNASAQEEGAGILNPTLAIQLAQQSGLQKILNVSRQNTDYFRQLHNLILQGNWGDVQKFANNPDGFKTENPSMISRVGSRVGSLMNRVF